MSDLSYTYNYNRDITSIHNKYKCEQYKEMNRTNLKKNQILSNRRQNANIWNKRSFKIIQ